MQKSRGGITDKVHLKPCKVLKVPDFQASTPKAHPPASAKVPMCRRADVQEGRCAECSFHSVCGCLSAVVRADLPKHALLLQCWASQLIVRKIFIWPLEIVRYNHIKLLTK